MASYRISKILVPLDGSERSFAGLDHAVYLARQCGATITGVCCVPMYPPVMGGSQVSWRKKVSRQAKGFMEKTKRACAQKGVVFNYRIISGIVTMDIAGFANRKKFDLVVIGHRGHTTAREIFLGSVANAILHRCRMPVMVIK